MMETILPTRWEGNFAHGLGRTSKTLKRFKVLLSRVPGRFAQVPRDMHVQYYQFIYSRKCMQF